MAENTTIAKYLDYRHGYKLIVLLLLINILFIGYFVCKSNYFADFRLLIVPHETTDSKVTSIKRNKNQDWVYPNSGGSGGHRNAAYDISFKYFTADGQEFNGLLTTFNSHIKENGYVRVTYATSNPNIVTFTDLEDPYFGRVVLSTFCFLFIILRLGAELIVDILFNHTLKNKLSATATLIDKSVTEDKKRNILIHKYTWKYSINNKDYTFTTTSKQTSLSGHNLVYYALPHNINFISKNNDLLFFDKVTELPILYNKNYPSFCLVNSLDLDLDYYNK